MFSLHEIEKALTTLWLNREAREWLKAGVIPQAKPKSLEGVSVELLQEIDASGISLYSNLLKIGHHDVMLSVYPYCAAVLGKQWEAVVDDYLKRFPPDHYNFNRLCHNFPKYFTTYGATYLEKFPYLAELADYEWLELEVIESDVEIEMFPHQPLSTPDEMRRLRPVVNPTLTIRYYQFAIPKIIDALESKHRLTKKVTNSPLYVAMYRHPHLHSSQCLEIDATASKAIKAAASNNQSYEELVKLAILQTPELELTQSVCEFLELIDTLQENHVFVGSKTIE